jgi:hypothetical protein
MVSFVGLLVWRRREDCHHDQALRPGIANGMRHAGRGESGVARRQEFRLFAYANNTTPFQQHVELILALVRVKAVLLVGLKGVQSGKKRIAFDESVLPHFVGCEDG